jgi:hypothetical protein
MLQRMASKMIMAAAVTMAVVISKPVDDGVDEGDAMHVICFSGVACT